MGIEIIVKGVSSTYELEHLARVFFAGAKLRKGQCTRGAVVYARIGANKLAVGLRAQNGKCVVASAEKPKKLEEQKFALSWLLYMLLKKECGVHPPWGLLTGVRPVNLLRKKLLLGQQAAREYLVGQCDVTSEKYDMACEIIECQKPYLEQNQKRDYSLYISIPFCPSRCSYCSFVSQNIQNEAHLVNMYLDKLEQELAVTADEAVKNGLRLSTIYIGGGTPTALSAQQLEWLLDTVSKYFDTTSVSEYTVEAGRPDCTDDEKLDIIKKHGVTRVSINPQSFSNHVLNCINRKHTAQDIVRCFNDARKVGHDNINMDVIAGLPGDNEENFAKTVQKAIELRPENITVHSLTLKRASTIVTSGQAKGQSIVNMLDVSPKMLYDAGYKPYYLYRQKSGVDNLENTGWALQGKQGRYNIYIMEEVQSILAVGAGGSTKLVDIDAKRIVRIYNHKLPKEYIDNFDVITQRKKGVSDFYASYLDT